MVLHNWMVVRGFETGIQTEYDAERFTRNIPDAYALKFGSEKEAYRYWEHHFRRISERIPKNWQYKHLVANLRLHPHPNDLSNASAVGVLERSIDTAGPSVRRAEQNVAELPLISPVTTLTGLPSTPHSTSSSLSTSGKSSFTVEYHAPGLRSTAPQAGAADSCASTQTYYTAPTPSLGLDLVAHPSSSRPLRSSQMPPQPSSSRPPTDSTAPVSTSPSTSYGFSTPHQSMLDALIEIEQEYAGQPSATARWPAPGPAAPTRSRAKLASTSSWADSIAEATRRKAPSPGTSTGPQGKDTGTKAGSSTPLQQARSRGAFQPASQGVHGRSPPLRLRASQTPADPDASTSHASALQHESAHARTAVYAPPQPHASAALGAQTQPQPHRAQASRDSHPLAAQPVRVRIAPSTPAVLPVHGQTSTPAQPKVASTIGVGASASSNASRAAAGDCFEQAPPPTLVWAWNWEVTSDNVVYPYDRSELRPLLSRWGGEVPRFNRSIPVPPPGPWSDHLQTAHSLRPPTRHILRQHRDM